MKKQIIIMLTMLFIVSNAGATTIWFVSDTHVYAKPTWKHTIQRFYDAINDTNFQSWISSMSYHDLPGASY